MPLKLEISTAVTQTSEHDYIQAGSVHKKVVSQFANPIPSDILALDLMSFVPH